MKLFYIVIRKNWNVTSKKNIDRVEFLCLLFLFASQFHILKTPHDENWVVYLTYYQVTWRTYCLQKLAILWLYSALKISMQWEVKIKIWDVATEKPIFFKKIG